MEKRFEDERMNESRICAEELKRQLDAVDEDALSKAEAQKLVEQIADKARHIYPTTKDSEVRKILTDVYSKLCRISEKHLISLRVFKDYSSFLEMCHNYSEAIEYATKLESIIDTDKIDYDPQERLRLYKFICRINEKANTLNLETVLRFYRKAIELLKSGVCGFSEESTNFELQSIYKQTGKLFLSNGKPENALISFDLSMSFAIASKDANAVGYYRSLIDCHIEKAKIYSMLNKKEKAIECYKTVIFTAEYSSVLPLKDKNSALIIAYSDLGHFYQKNNKNNRAINCFEKALEQIELSKKINDDNSFTLYRTGSGVKVSDTQSLTARRYAKLAIELCAIYEASDLNKQILICAAKAVSLLEESVFDNPINTVGKENITSEIDKIRLKKYEETCSYLVMLYNKLISCCRNLGNIEEAEMWLNRNIILTEALASQEIEPYPVLIALVYCDAADAYNSIDTEKSLFYCRKAIEKSKKAEKAAIKNPMVVEPMLADLYFVCSGIISSEDPELSQQLKDKSLSLAEKYKDMSKRCSEIFDILS